MIDLITAARRQVLIAVIGAVAVVAAAIVPPVIDGLSRDRQSCSALISQLDRLSPEMKALYAKPGPPAAGVPELASSDDVEHWERCGGDPERLLEQATQ